MKWELLLQRLYPYEFDYIILATSKEGRVTGGGSRLGKHPEYIPIPSKTVLEILYVLSKIHDRPGIY
jgi:hypothetical protein